MMRGIKRRTVMLAGIGVLGMAAAGVVYAAHYYLDPSPAPGSLTARVRGGEVDANGITFRIPAGWTVKRTDNADYCTQPDRTILIGKNLKHGLCAWREAISVQHWDAESHDWQPSGLWTPIVREMTLPGGQPAWITDPFGNHRSWEAPPETATFTAYLPWASVRLEFSLNGQSLAPVLSSVHSERVEPARLTVARDVDAMRLGGEYDIETDAVKGVLDLLTGLDQVVGTGAPCAGATFDGGWEWSDGSPALLALSRGGRRVGALVYHFRNGCGFVTSSRGGRVWVPKELELTVAEALRIHWHFPAPRPD